jgi:hypothetical protein
LANPASGDIGADSPDAGYQPDYAVLAVSDPAADVTSTQTWSAVGTNRSVAASPALAAPPAAAPRPAPQRQPLTQPRHGPERQPSWQTGPQGQPSRHTGPQRQPGGRTGTQQQPVPPRRHAAGQAPAARQTPAARPAPAPHRRDRRSVGPAEGLLDGDFGGERRSRARTGWRREHARTLLATAAAVILALGVGGYALFKLSRGNAGSTAARLQHTSAAAPLAGASRSASLGQWGHIATRAGDPVPLTVAQLYPLQFTAAGTSYTRTASKKASQCTNAVFGARLISAVAHAGCSQVVRASYLSDTKMMGTIGVLNLRTVAAAERTGKATGPTHFIAQLPGAKGPTRDLTKGTGIEEAEVKGHYLILVWAEFTDRRTPKTTAQRQQLENFISVVIRQSANVSLTSRLVTGRPAAS